MFGRLRANLGDAEAGQIIRLSLSNCAPAVGNPAAEYPLYGLFVVGVIQFLARRPVLHRRDLPVILRRRILVLQIENPCVIRITCNHVSFPIGNSSPAGP
jgi:hypothetical protein